MEQKIDIAIIGECLIELSSNGSLADTSTLNKYFGGDTVTTAVALARMGGKVTYLTKVGNDGFSEFIISSLKRENIDTSLIKSNEEQNGMYIVSHTLNNKEVLYYKRKTAATKLSIEDLLDKISLFNRSCSISICQLKRINPWDIQNSKGKWRLNSIRPKLYILFHEFKRYKRTIWRNYRLHWYYIS